MHVIHCDPGLALHRGGGICLGLRTQSELSACMAVDLRTTLQGKSSWRDQGLQPPPGSPEDCPLRLGTELTVSSPLSPLSSQEEDFIRPSSREEAQQLWEAERVKMRQILDKQQKQMVEDNQWLRQEEKSLVSSR